jgi:excisionase family DNA binding protein
MTDSEAAFYATARSYFEVAEFFRVSYPYVKREAHEGRLRVTKLSRGVVRIMPSDLIAWVNRGANIESFPMPAHAERPPEVSLRRPRGRPKKVALLAHEEVQHERVTT